jgi:hypothetical protein
LGRIRVSGLRIIIFLLIFSCSIISEFRQCPKVVETGTSGWLERTALKVGFSAIAGVTLNRGLGTLAV